MKVLSFDMGTRNLAFAVVDAPDTIKRMGVIDLFTNTSRDAANVLLDSLDGPNAWMLDCCDEVVVELQPTNGACKILSYVLMMYFREHDRHHGAPIRPFRFMSAGFKLKLFPEMRPDFDLSIYEGRKAAGVAMAIRVIDGNKREFGDFFNEQSDKRKTDLADAIVQGCQHIKCPDPQAKKYRRLLEKNIAD